MRSKLLLLAALLVHFATSADAGTIFTVAGSMGRGAKFSGTLEIDTIAGKIDAVDIYASPVVAAWFGYAFQDNTVHVAKSGGVPYQQYSTVAQVALSASEGPILGGLFLVIPAPTLVGYEGGPLVPTTNVMIFQSGLDLRSAYDHYENTYWPLSSGSLTPLVVPEPSSLVLATLGHVGLAAWGWRRKHCAAIW